jgi:hypothetical protein
LVSPPRQCSSTTTNLRQGCFGNEKYENTKASPYLLTWLQMIFTVASTEISNERTALIGDTDITKNATEELKGLSQDGLQEYFQHIYSTW